MYVASDLTFSSDALSGVRSSSSEPSSEDSISSSLSFFSSARLLPLGGGGAGTARAREAFFRFFAISLLRNLIFGMPGSPSASANRSTGSSSSLKIDLFFCRCTERKYETKA